MSLPTKSILVCACVLFLMQVNYRQSIDKLKYSSVTSTPQIIQAKINAQQLSDVSNHSIVSTINENHSRCFICSKSLIMQSCACLFNISPNKFNGTNISLFNIKVPKVVYKAKRK